MRCFHFSSLFKSLSFFAISLLFANFAALVLAVSSSYDVHRLSVVDTPKLPLPAELIYEFPPGFLCENLAVRRNGQILVTIATVPQVYQVDPFKKKDAILLYSFPATTVTGIAELEPDVFYVATGNITFSNDRLSPVPGSSAIWKLDLRSFSAKDGQPAKVSKIAAFPKATLLNGVAVLNRRKGLLLAADSALGLIWQLNVHTKEIKIFFDDPLAKAPPDAQIPTGVNGIKVRKGAVYFSNSFLGIIARLIVKNKQTPLGPAVPVATGLNVIDDFAIGPNGAFFAAQNPNNALSYTPAAGGAAQIIANITTNPSAVAFGRRPEDAHSVYVSSFGGNIQEFLSSSSPLRGKIFTVDVKAFL